MKTLDRTISDEPACFARFRFKVGDAVLWNRRGEWIPATVKRRSFSSAQGYLIHVPSMGLLNVPVAALKRMEATV